MSRSSFVADRPVKAGTDLGILYAVILLAGLGCVPEYSGVNAIAYGLRGFLGLLVGMLSVRLRLPFWTIFAISAGLILIASFLHVLIGKVTIPTSGAGLDVF